LSRKKKLVAGINYASFFDSNLFLIDSGLILFFNKPHSFTGEDIIELHAHGNDLILDSLVFRCVGLGARLAYNGEFSFRAFLNNKIDLIQAESINSLIKSNSLNSNKLIFKSLSGKFSDVIKVIISDLSKLKLYLDATIEFPDHLSFSFNDFYSSFLVSYNNYLSIFDKVVSDDFLCESLNVVIFGNVNVGKSSLFNFLLKTDRAIVSDIPGTTRDFIESNLCLKGFNFRLIDTAGFNPFTEDFIEKISIERTLNQIRKANILICVVDVLHEYDFLNSFNLNKLLLMAESKMKLILLRNKIDRQVSKDRSK
jgi:tRNA modification GTPase